MSQGTQGETFLKEAGMGTQGETFLVEALEERARDICEHTEVKTQGEVEFL